MASSQFVAFYIEPDGAHIPISYVHFTNCGDIFLVGGACTNGHALRAMHAEDQLSLRNYGGVMLATLRHGFKRYGPKCQAIFTCCKDSQALVTTLKAGFVETDMEHLLVKWPIALDDDSKRELVAKENFLIGRRRSAVNGMIFDQSIPRR